MPQSAILGVNKIPRTICSFLCSRRLDLLAHPPWVVVVAPTEAAAGRVAFDYLRTSADASILARPRLKSSPRTPDPSHARANSLHGHRERAQNHREAVMALPTMNAIIWFQRAHPLPIRGRMQAANPSPMWAEQHRHCSGGCRWAALASPAAICWTLAFKTCNPVILTRRTTPWFPRFDIGDVDVPFGTYYLPFPIDT